jgi:hypothetical protein
MGSYFLRWLFRTLRNGFFDLAEWIVRRFEKK